MVERPSARPHTAADEDVPALPTVDPSVYEVLGEYARGGLGRILRARD